MMREIENLKSRVQKLLNMSGVSKLCTDCSLGKLGPRWRDGTWGCCQGCENLTPTGCKEKPLSCAIWLCHAAKQKHLDIASVLDKIRNGLHKISYRTGLMGDGWRTNGLTQEKRSDWSKNELVQIDGLLR